MYLDAIYPMLCYSHMTKNLKQDIDKAYQDKRIQYIVSGVIGHLFSLTTIDAIKKYLRIIVLFFGAPMVTKQFVSARKYLLIHRLHSMQN